MNPWFIYGMRPLSKLDRIKLLLGYTLYVRFDSPNGECNAACDLSVMVSRAAVDKLIWTPTALTRWMNKTTQ